MAPAPRRSSNQFVDAGAAVSGAAKKASKAGGAGATAAGPAAKAPAAKRRKGNDGKGVAVAAPCGIARSTSGSNGGGRGSGEVVDADANGVGAGALARGPAAKRQKKNAGVASAVSAGAKGSANGMRAGVATAAGGVDADVGGGKGSARAGDAAVGSDVADEDADSMNESGSNADDDEDDGEVEDEDDDEDDDEYDDGESLADLFETLADRYLDGSDDESDDDSDADSDAGSDDSGYEDPDEDSERDESGSGEDGKGCDAATDEAGKRKNQAAIVKNNRSMAMAYDCQVRSMTEEAGLPPRQDGASPDENASNDTFWAVAHTSKLDGSARDKASTFIPPEKYARAQKRRAERAERKKKKREEQTKKEQERAKRRGDDLSWQNQKRGKKRKRKGAEAKGAVPRRDKQSYRRGNPRPEDVPTGPPSLMAPARGYWDMMQRQTRGQNPMKGVRVDKWGKTVYWGEVEAAAHRGYHDGTPMGRDIANALLGKSDPAAASAARWWENKFGESLNESVGGNVRFNQQPHVQVSRSVRRRPYGAGVYVAVLLKGDDLVGVYVGRTKSFFFRFVEHMTTIVYGEKLPYFHQTARSADSVIFFPVFEDSSATRFDKRSQRERAILEGIWCFLLGSFTASSELLAIRRKHGMPNLGDKVVGCNGTPCCEEPEKEKKNFKYSGLVQDIDYKAANDRVRLYTKLMQFRLCENKPLAHASMLALKQAAQDARADILANLFATKSLRFSAPKHKDQRIVLSLRLRRGDEFKRVSEIAKSGDLLLEVREGAAGEGTLTSLSIPDRALFGDLQLVVKSTNPAEKREVVLHRHSAPLTPYLRELFGVALRSLPAHRRAARLAAHKAAVTKIADDRPTHYDTLDEETKRAVDFVYFIQDTGIARIEGRVVSTIKRRSKSKAKDIEALRRKGNMPTDVAPSKARRAPAVPFGIGVDGKGKDAAAFKAKKKGAHENWTFRIAPNGSSDTVPLPYRIDADQHRTSDNALTRFLISRYEDLDPAITTRSDKTPSLFMRQQHSLKQNCGGAASVMIFRRSYPQGKQNTFDVHFTAEETKKILGKAWRKGKKNQKETVWIEIVGAGKTRGEELDLRISLDGVNWYRKADMDLVRPCRARKTNRKELYAYVRTCRLAEEALTGGEPMVDGVYARQMTWGVPAAAAAANPSAPTTNPPAPTINPVAAAAAAAAAAGHPSRTPPRPRPPAQPAQPARRPHYDESDSDDSDDGDETHVADNANPSHACVVPGSIFKTLRNGHCGWEALARQLGYRTAKALRHKLYWSLGNSEADMKIKRAIYPNGIPPEGDALKEFLRTADVDQYLDHPVMQRIADLLRCTIVVVSHDHPNQSARFVPRGPGGQAGGIVGLYHYAAGPGHFKGFFVDEDAELPPLAPEFDL